MSHAPGVLVSVDRREERARAFLSLVVADGVDLATSEAVVAQVWRDGRRQSLLARFLRHVDVRPLDDGRVLGELLRSAGTDDPVDAHLVELASVLGRPVLTGDPDDVQQVADALDPRRRPRVLSW